MKNKINFLKHLKILIVTHYCGTGPATELRDYFIRNKMSFIYHELPFTYAKKNCPSSITYTNGKETKIRIGLKLLKIDFFYYIRDLLSVIFLNTNKHDIAFGFDNLNTLGLIILKRIGFIKKVIYVCVDYMPIRFKNKFLNKIYHYIEKFCCYNSDLIWDSSESIKNARVNFNRIDLNKIKPILVVEDGNNFEEEKIKSISELDKYRLVYMGTLKEYQGLDMLLDVFQELNKWNKKIKLSILGDGPLFEILKKKAIFMNIDKEIFFSGYIDDHEIISDYLRKCYIAFALYENNQNSVSKYSAVGKPNTYMGCGLPVVITSVPSISKKIDILGAGKIVKFEKNVIVNTVKEILSNEYLYATLRKNAIQFASENTWDKIFEYSIKETKKKLL